MADCILKTEPLPRKMQHLPIDDRGYVIPWFVEYVDGKPEFRCANQGKFAAALSKKLCWVCGTALGTNFAFVAGPMCGINKVSSEPPSHLECARWSARNCPFLANPQMVRREDETYNRASLKQMSAGEAISRNPGVVMIWITREFEIFRANNRGVLMLMGRPNAVEWYAWGKSATRAQVLESIEDGFPSLLASAYEQPGAPAELRRARQRFEKWLP
jgi:hypothetical protein